jgi:GNAT superfamily N-acetyltransferase
LTGEKFIVGTHFYVKPEFRHTAIGKKLHNKYLNVGHNLGVSRVVRQVTKEHSQHLIGKGQKITDVIVEERI